MKGLGWTPRPPTSRCVLRLGCGTAQPTGGRPLPIGTGPAHRVLSASPRDPTNPTLPSPQEIGLRCPLLRPYWPTGRQGSVYGLGSEPSGSGAGVGAIGAGAGAMGFGALRGAA